MLLIYRPSSTNLLIHLEPLVTFRSAWDQQKGPSFINLDVFNQILDMDDDEEGDDEEAFSEGIVGGFFDQAETTFASMEKALYIYTTLH